MRALRSLFFLGVSMLFSTMWASDYAEIDYLRARAAYLQGEYATAAESVRAVASENEVYAGLYLHSLWKMNDPGFMPFYQGYSEKGRADSVDRIAAAYCFEKENYEKAFDIASSLQKPGSADTFIAGVSAAKIGRAEESTKYLDIAEKDVAFKQQVRKFRNSLELELPSVRERKIADSYSSFSRPDAEGKKFQGFLSIGSEYSNNVALRPSDSSLPFPFTNEDDANLFAFLSGKYEFLRNSCWKGDARASLYKSRHFHLDEFDLWGTMFELNMYRLLNNPGEYILFSFQPEYYWLEDDSFLNRNAFELSWNKKLRENWNARLIYRFEQNRHFVSKGREGLYHEFRLENAFYLNSTLRLDWELAFGANNAHGDYDYYRYMTELGLWWQFHEKQALKAGFQMMLDDFSREHSIFATHRQDSHYHPFIGWFYYFRPDCYLNARYDFRTNDSNIAYHDYDKSTFSVSLNYLF